MSDNKSGKSFIAGAIIGGLIGAASALLFAPKAGKELREDITEQYHKTSAKTKEIAETVSHKTQEIAKEVSEKTQHIAKDVSAKSQELAEKAKLLAGQVANDVRNWKESRDQTATASEAVIVDDTVESLQDRKSVV